MVLFLEFFSDFTIFVDFHRKVVEKVFFDERDRPKWRKDICLAFEFQVDIPTVASLLELKLERLFLIDEKSDLRCFNMLKDLELPSVLDGFRLS